jgi:hypothetical protein
MSEEQRCPNCGALVSADARWCGQCYAPLEAAQEEPGAAPISGETSATEAETRGEGPGEGSEATATVAEASKVVPLRTRKTEPAWPCPVCDNRNPLELDACAACGTPFARLLQEPERRPEISPQSALLSSLIFPGLGHWKCGKPFDGLARAVLFTWTLATVLVIALSRSGKGGFGATIGLLGLFLVATVLLYVLSALDAHRIASGESELMTSRILLWGSAGLMLLAAIVATLITLPALQGG